MAKIGNRESAMQRMTLFASRVELYLGRRPTAVVLFAEDYDAIADHVKQLSKQEGYRIERGPSIQEYV